MNTTTETQPVAAALGYGLFDADNHYYESEDAFLRYVDPRIEHRAPRWVQMDNGTRRLIFGDRMNRFVGADHTFNMVGKPGGLKQGEAGCRGPATIEPRAAHARNTGERDARLARMNEQGLEASLFFPTFAVSVEALLVDDVEAELTPARTPFNRWLNDDWGGLHYQGTASTCNCLAPSLLDLCCAPLRSSTLCVVGRSRDPVRTGSIVGCSPLYVIYHRLLVPARGRGRCRSRPSTTCHPMTCTVGEMAKVWVGYVEPPCSEHPSARSPRRGLGIARSTTRSRRSCTAGSSSGS